MRNDLANLPPMIPQADAYDVGERYVFLDTVEVAARDGIQWLDAAGADTDNPYWKTFLSGSFAKSWATAAVDWDIVMQMGNVWFDRAADACRKPTRAERRAALQDIDADCKKTLQSASDWKTLAISFFGNRRKFVSQQMGRQFLAKWLSGKVAVARVEDRVAMTAELGQLAFALAAYRADHGRYPARLAELSPANVAEIPKDFFNHDADLHYAPQGEGYLLYSVGENGRRWRPDVQRAQCPESRARVRRHRGPRAKPNGAAFTPSDHSSHRLASDMWANCRFA